MNKTLWEIFTNVPLPKTANRIYNSSHLVEQCVLLPKGNHHQKELQLKNLFLYTCLLFCSNLFALQVHVNQATVPSPNTLEQEIQSVLDKHSVPGAAVVIIGKEGTRWQKTFGLADIEMEREVQQSTRFRVGSLSKMLIAMSVMKLSEQGNLRLTDKLAEVAPEVNFINPWSTTHPVTIADLLAHTTGWDGTHFAVNAHNSADPVSVSEAVAFHPHSRISRWAPGTRTAYSNDAPVIAAYLVEKFSGLTFERFIEEHFLDPLKMHQTGYFNSDAYQHNASQQYIRTQPVAYRHLLNRPSGGLNTTIGDLANLAEFLLRAGKGESSVLSAESILSMQLPSHTSASIAGLEVNWGLGLQSFSHNGVIFYGHEGTLHGAQAMLVFQPDLNLAYAIVTNTNGPAVSKIHRIIAESYTHETKIRDPKIPTEQPAAPANLPGYYRPINSLSTFTEISALFTPFKISLNHKQFDIKPLIGGQVRHLTIDRKGNIIQPDSGKTVLVQALDPIVGNVLHYGPTTLQKISALNALAPIAMLLLWLLLSLATIMFALIWISRLLTKRLVAGPQIWVRLCPLATVLTVLFLLLLLKSLFADTFPERLLGNMSVQSVCIMLLTLTYAILTIANFIPLFVYRKLNMNRVMYRFQSLYAVVNLLVMGTLLSYGIIGIRTWTY